MDTLTLEQAYYIGELMAAVVVVLLLLFVAQQLRQNTGAFSRILYTRLAVAESTRAVNCALFSGGRDGWFGSIVLKNVG